MCTGLVLARYVRMRQRRRRSVQVPDASERPEYGGARGSDFDLRGRQRGRAACIVRVLCSCAVVAV